MSMPCSWTEATVSIFPGDIVRLVEVKQLMAQLPYFLRKGHLSEQMTKTHGNGDWEKKNLWTYHDDK